MNIFATIIVVLGVLLVVGFLVYEVIQLVRDIRKHIAKKKAAKKDNQDDNNSNTK